MALRSVDSVRGLPLVVILPEAKGPVLKIIGGKPPRPEPRNESGDGNGNDADRGNDRP